jgi:hypothetical protein
LEKHKVAEPLLTPLRAPNDESQNEGLDIAYTSASYVISKYHAS